MNLQPHFQARNRCSRRCRLSRLGGHLRPRPRFEKDNTLRRACRPRRVTAAPQRYACACVLSRSRAADACFMGDSEGERPCSTTRRARSKGSRSTAWERHCRTCDRPHSGPKPGAGHARRIVLQRLGIRRRRALVERARRLKALCASSGRLQPDTRLCGVVRGRRSRARALLVCCEQPVRSPEQGGFPVTRPPARSNSPMICGGPQRRWFSTHVVYFDPLVFIERLDALVTARRGWSS